MTQTQTLPANRAQTKRPSSWEPARLFYPASAVLMLVLGIVGFNRFFLHGLAYPDREIAPPIRTLVIVHGVAMTGWLLFLVVQTILVARRSVRLHMTLGRVGAVLAALVVILGIWIAIASASVTPPEARIWGIPPRQFMAVPFVSALIFAAYVSVGVLYRRKPAVHRPMMLLATLSAMAAPVSRIDVLNDLYVGTTWERLFGPFFMALVIGLLLLFARCLLTRSFDRWFAAGLAALILANALIWQVAPTALWERFAALLVR